MLPAESESESVAEGKTRQLRDGRWSVQCKWCEEKKTEQADDDSAFNEMLKKCNWRLTNPRNWRLGHGPLPLFLRGVRVDDRTEAHHGRGRDV